MAKRFPNMKRLYSGPVWLDESQLEVKYDTPETWKHAKSMGLNGPRIFVEHMNDLFADGVDPWWTSRILRHCTDQGNRIEFVVQTKRPDRAIAWSTIAESCLPPYCFFGTTIESDIFHEGITAGWLSPLGRASYFKDVLKYRSDIRPFVTVEPILKFNHSMMIRVISACKPGFVNIGADSKGAGLPEPTSGEITALVAELRARGITVNLKSNLQRLMK
jgi:hypothetical protein